MGPVEEASCLPVDSPETAQTVFEPVTIPGFSANNGSSSEEVVGPKKVEGVLVDWETVKHAVVRDEVWYPSNAPQTKIWSTMGELMRQGALEKGGPSSPEETM